MTRSTRLSNQFTEKNENLNPTVFIVWRVTKFVPLGLERAKLPLYKMAV